MRAYTRANRPAPAADPRPSSDVAQTTHTTRPHGARLVRVGKKSTQTQTTQWTFPVASLIIATSVNNLNQSIKNLTEPLIHMSTGVAISRHQHHHTGSKPCPCHDCHINQSITSPHKATHGQGEADRSDTPARVANLVSRSNTGLQYRHIPHLGLNKIFVHFNAFVNEPILIALSPPPVMPTLLQ